MGFRIGSKFARHTYPDTPRGGPQQILQIGSDLLVDSFPVTGSAAPAKVDKTAGTLLEVPLPGFRRANGLWIQATGLVVAGDTSIGMSYFPWFKFASLAQYFSPVTTLIASGITLATVSISDALSISLEALIQLPAQSSDGAPIALPVVDDLLVGIATAGTADYSLAKMTSIVAAEVNSSIITQNSPISVDTLP